MICNNGICMKMSSLIVVISYIIVGVVLTVIDPVVLPIYMTILPFHGYLLYKSFKIKNLLFILLCLMTFLSHGVGSIVFYLDRDNASSTGFGAIGDFDFSYGRLFSSYSYLAVFLLFLLLFVSFSQKKYHQNFLSIFIKQQYERLKMQSMTWSLKPIVFAVILFSIISIWMYNHHIGMTGLKQTELPFHMTGALFYARRFLFPVILVWIFFKTKSKNIASILLILYSLIVGVLATSKSAALLVLVPLIYLNYMMGKKMMFYLCLIASVVVYIVVGEMRLLIYDMDADVDVLTIFTSAYDFFPEERNLFLFIVKNITGRLYGLQSTVLGDQYTKLNFDGLVDFYTTSKIIDVIPDYVPTLFGINLPSDKAYGVGLGYSGTMQLLSCHNYLFTIFQSLIVSFVFCIQNNCIQDLFLKKNGVIIKYVSVLIVFLSFILFYDGNQMLYVYILTLLLLLIHHYCRPKSQKMKSISSV